MNKKYHRETGGVWVMSERDAPSFKEGDAISVYAKQVAENEWVVVALLEDGREIRLEYDVWNTIEKAEIRAAHWDAMLAYPSRRHKREPKGDAIMSESKSDKPRICEVLGVEVGEEFTFEDTDNYYRIAPNGNIEVLMFGKWENSRFRKLVKSINGELKIIHNTLWTMQDVEDARAVRRMFPKVHYVERDERIDEQTGSNQILFKASPDGRGETLLYMSVALFPSLKPGRGASLDDILAVESLDADSTNAEKHGEWIAPHFRSDVHCYNCSICGEEAQHREYDGVKMYYKFCPACGAEMR